MEYLTPGVYVEEVSTGAKPIEGVSTTTAAFVGVAPRDDSYVDEVRACNSWTEFVRDYVNEDSKGTHLARGVYGFFMNGGRRCLVLNVGAKGSVAGDARKGTGVNAFEAYDEPSMILAPGATGTADVRALIDHAEKMRDRVAIVDVVERVQDVTELTAIGSVDPEPATGDAAAPAGGGKGKAKPSSGKRPPDSKYATCYYPWLVMKDPFGEGNVTVPPSGHMAGIWAMNDVQRGVHKAPANYPIRTVVGLSHRLTAEQHGILNLKGVNGIRLFERGIRVFGARLLSDDPEWRYLNVRRFFNFAEKSILNGTMWTVFEPNDQTTRNSVARDVRAFLKLQWLAGALVGATPEQAFFVKCDGENNSQEVVDAGRLIIDVGVAVSKPAEFVIFRIGQWAGGSEAA